MLFAINSCATVVVAIVVGLMFCSVGFADTVWDAQPVAELEKGERYRLVAQEDIDRLQVAWQAGGAERDAMVQVFARVDTVIEGESDIPEHVGQHNQFYQCDHCQLGLKTVDAHHHQCPKCKHVYSGYPYDNVLYKNRHNSNSHRMEEAGFAWAVTGEEKYAQVARDMLVRYAQLYPGMPVHSPWMKEEGQKAEGYNLIRGGKLGSQTLDESMWICRAAIAYDLIYDSGVLSDDDKRLIEQDLFKLMADKIAMNPMGKSNWQTWHNAGLLHAGAVLGDATMINATIFDEENGFIAQTKISILPDGMWYENSWGYHYYTLLAMSRLAEGARGLGVDLFGHPMLKKMYLVGFDYQLSDGSLPRIGDAVQSSTKNDFVNERAWYAYRDARLLATFDDQPSFDSVRFGRPVGRVKATVVADSKVFPGAGNAILRTNGEQRLSAGIAFGPFGGFHGHFDKLSFVFTAKDHEFAVDPGRAASQAYRLPIHSQWYRSTFGHNTVLIDAKDQDEATGELIAFVANENYAAVAAGAGPISETVEHRRLILLTDGYLLVVDELQANDSKTHRFDLLYHNLGEVGGVKLDTAEADLPEIEGVNYLEDVKGYTLADGDGPACEFAMEGVAVHMTTAVLGGRDVSLVTATGPFRSVEDRVPMAIVPVTGEHVYYATVLEPVIEGSQPRVGGVAMRVTEQGLVVGVQLGEAGEVVGFDGESISAKFIVQRVEKGKATKVVLVGEGP